MSIYRESAASLIVGTLVRGGGADCQDLYGRLATHLRRAVLGESIHVAVCILSPSHDELLEVAGCALRSSAAGIAAVR